MILTGPVKEFGLEGVCQPQTEGKGALRVIIRDTGCGMSQEGLSQLFQMISQVGNITTKMQIETGLELFILKEIIENLRGQVRVYCKSQVGTAFIICLPTTALSIIQSQLSERHICVNENLIPRLKAKKFTTIPADDSSFNVNLVCNFYSKIDVQVLATASNGKRAFDKYLEVVKSNGNIDIITLDIERKRGLRKSDNTRRRTTLRNR